MNFDTKLKPLASFSFSSLTDIVLLLLIFFLLTSQFVINNGVSVQLPKTENSEKTQPTRLIVTINSSGKIFFEGNPVSTEKLKKLLAEKTKGNKTESSLIIRADKATELENVVKVIDAAKGAGIVKFTVQTEKVR